MQLIETLKLYLNKYLKKLVTYAIKESTVNSLVSKDVNITSIAKITTANVRDGLQFVLINYKEL